MGFDPQNLLYSTCFATSEDGIFGERPNLGLVAYEGSKDTNIVLLNAAGGNVICDPHDPDPDRCYKSLFYESRDADGTSNEGDGVSVAFSPDGLHWTKYSGNPVITRASDSHTLLGWDELHRQYVVYCRPSLHEGNEIRRIGRSVSDDFIHWTDPEEILEPDEQDSEGQPRRRGRHRSLRPLCHAALCRAAPDPTPRHLAEPVARSGFSGSFAVAGLAATGDSVPVGFLQSGVSRA